MNQNQNNTDFTALLLIFGLAPGASLEEIKQRKQFKTRVTHPDVVPHDLREQANEELAKMNAAWDEINAWFAEHPEETRTPQPAGEEKPSEAAPPQMDDADCPDFEQWMKNQGNAWGVDVSLDIEQLERQRRQKLAIASRRDLVIKAKFAAGIVLALAFWCTCFAAKNQSARDTWLENWRQQAQYAVRYGDGAGSFNPAEIARKYNEMAAEQRRKWEEEDSKRLPSELLILAGVGAFLAIQFHPALRQRTETWIDAAPAE